MGWGVGGREEAVGLGVGRKVGSFNEIWSNDPV